MNELISGVVSIVKLVIWLGVIIYAFESGLVEYAISLF